MLPSNKNPVEKQSFMSITPESHGFSGTRSGSKDHEVLAKSKRWTTTEWDCVYRSVASCKAVLASTVANVGDDDLHEINLSYKKIGTQYKYRWQASLLNGSYFVPNGQQFLNGTKMDGTPNCLFFVFSLNLYFRRSYRMSLRELHRYWWSLRAFDWYLT